MKEGRHHSKESINFNLLDKDHHPQEVLTEDVQKENKSKLRVTPFGINRNHHENTISKDRYKEESNGLPNLDRH
jgi:hypothetical protein